MSDLIFVHPDIKEVPMLIWCAFFKFKNIEDLIHTCM